LLSPAKAKEKALKALFARKLIEKGWLTALLSLYVLKRREARVGLKHVGDVALQRKDFGPWQGLHTTLLGAGQGCLRSLPELLVASLSRRTPFHS